MFALTILQESLVETTAYMIAGYAVIFGVMILYLFSLWWRWRNYQRDLEVLEEIEKRGQR
jgi:preprotein translocase subunit Sec63